MRAMSGLLLIACAMVVQAQAGESRIPAIHSTDLFHPHGDPDDHYDLATAFAMAAMPGSGLATRSRALPAVSKEGSARRPWRLRYL